MSAELSTLLTRPAVEVAPRLLGCTLIRKIDGIVTECIIVETEAYAQTDPASHSYRGLTERTRVMFGPAGYLYVYFTYGMHYCANIVTGLPGDGSAVLIRAVEPLGDTVALEQRRGSTGFDLTNGPAKLCQALAIDATLNGHDLSKQPLRLQLTSPRMLDTIVTTTRIGISRATDVPWRFYIRNNPYVSKP